ncbi:branched-chain amino acid transport system carrier protein BraB [Gottschalkia purinilytica]|uniref:Branched-chain amino acid transport system carrier protein n=1 Tax=Gottschalkia purinilytica TaxID=1503 RepID=A0A0L0W7I7_GOTPU|nr:branched-chain amino acid transport system II carrier protein [Gottschalkia purinilytica]KNF07469.1 branched-chain amino acid transport system carrier protein BraB [Gottschalkia purinilytica]
MKNSFKDIITVGLALFAMFFGAGNLMFPPSLGYMAGKSWVPAMIGFIITGAGMSLLGIIATSKAGGSIENVGKEVGAKFSRFFSVLIMLCVGPLLAIPRTGATTFEMGVLPFMTSPGKEAAIITSIVFFGLTVYFTITPSKVIDRVGKVLTPVLMISLLIIIVKGIVLPIGKPISTNIKLPFSEGFAAGYQTMDALASMVFAGIIIGYFVQKGYNDTKSQISLTIKAGIISMMGFIIIYGGLTYLGATSSSVFSSGSDQTVLTMNIVKSLLGNIGQTLLSITVSLACLTTSIGLTATCGDFFSRILNGKVGYKAIIIIISVYSGLMSIIGVDNIVKISNPILKLIYPIAIILMILNVVDEHIKNKNIYKGAVLGAFLISLFNTLDSIGMSLKPINNLIAKIPFASLGFAWVIPAIIGGLIAKLFTHQYNKQELNSN